MATLRPLLILWQLELVNINDVETNTNPAHRWWLVKNDSIRKQVLTKINEIQLLEEEDVDSKAVEIRPSAFSATTSAASSEKIEEKKKATHTTSFHGNLVVSMTRDMIAQLYAGNTKFWLSLKSDGVRFELYFMTLDGYNVTFWVDRARRVFLLPIPAPESLYKGTLLEGDVTWNRMNASWEYHIYNCLQMNGVLCKKESYLQRMQVVQNALIIWNKLLGQPFPPPNERLIYTSLQKRWLLKTSCAISLWVKPFFHLWQAPRVFKHVESAWKREFDMDGDLLTENEGRRTFKLKRRTDNTCDAEIQFVDISKLESLVFSVPPSDTLKAMWKEEKYQQIPLLYTYDFDTAGKSHTKLFTAAMLSPMLSAVDFQKYKVGECRYDMDTNAWTIEIVRKDRSSANSWTTIQSTLRNIEENLTREDVFLFMREPVAQRMQFQPTLPLKGCLRLYMAPVVRKAAGTRKVRDPSEKVPHGKQ